VVVTVLVVVVVVVTVIVTGCPWINKPNENKKMIKIAKINFLLFINYSFFF
jgi:hypothetical protein